MGYDTQVGCEEVRGKEDRRQHQGDGKKEGGRNKHVSTRQGSQESRREESRGEGCTQEGRG